VRAARGAAKPSSDPSPCGVSAPCEHTFEGSRPSAARTDGSSPTDPSGFAVRGSDAYESSVNLFTYMGAVALGSGVASEFSKSGFSAFLANGITSTGVAVGLGNAGVGVIRDLITGGPGAGRPGGPTVTVAAPSAAPKTNTAPNTPHAVSAHDIPGLPTKSQLRGQLGITQQLLAENTINQLKQNPWAAAGAAIGTLVADDVTGVGAADDIAIPVVLAGAVAYDVAQRTFITYTLTNPATSQVYVGRTSGFGDPYSILRARMRTHHMVTRGFDVGSVDRAVQGLHGYPAVRGREQQLIDSLGGVGSPNVGNAIRAVAKANPAGRIYHAASDLYFGPLHGYTGY